MTPYFCEIILFIFFTFIDKKYFPVLSFSGIDNFINNFKSGSYNCDMEKNIPLF